MSIFKLALDHYSRFVLLPKKDTKKSTIAKRVGQTTQMCDPKTTRAYCCTKSNWIGSSWLWNNRPMPHILGLVAYIFAARKTFAERYYRGKIFLREDIFAGRYFRVNSIFAKISSRENISNSLFAKISSRENKVLYSILLFARLAHSFARRAAGPVASRSSVSMVPAFIHSQSCQ